MSLGIAESNKKYLQAYKNIMFLELLRNIKDVAEGKKKCGGVALKTYVGGENNCKVYEGYLPNEAPLSHKVETILKDFSDEEIIFSWNISVESESGYPFLMGFTEDDNPIVEAVQACGENNHAFFLVQHHEDDLIYCFAVGMTLTGSFIEFHKSSDGSWKCYPELL